MGENKWLRGYKVPEACRWEAVLKGAESGDKILHAARSEAGFIKGKMRETSVVSLINRLPLEAVFLCYCSPAMGS